MRKMVLVVGLLLAAAGVVAAAPMTALAEVGVGVNVGTIKVDEPLGSGGLYELPPIGVINTGDQPAVYSMRVTATGGQKEPAPDPSWITFSPESVTLGPGESKPVYPTLTLPIRAVPGDYYGLLVAAPSVAATAPGANIGVAAGTHLRFTVEQTNILLAIYYRIRDLMNMYSPWSWIILAAIVILAVGIPLARRYRFSLGVERRSGQE